MSRGGGALAASDTALVVADARVRALSAALGRLGWECIQADVDAAVGAARICLVHDSGRVVTLDADQHGRVSVTREQRAARTVAVGRRGDRFLAECVATEFIGRTRHDGIRSAMRTVAHYVADNAGGDRALVAGPLVALLGGGNEDEP